MEEKKQANGERKVEKKNIKEEKRKRRLPCPNSTLMVQLTLERPPLPLIAPAPRHPAPATIINHPLVPATLRPAPRQPPYV
ncbi:hypothetical protein E2C01_086434 [Portunus trituberculatus]|uniref:Uncharacterized protein n=1 Tax=Portunus trituberculatus TaxID=210409 RepID=A0A5B7J997_PORTR|nr:hypothetical protein [Portunus trituberculatus]